MLEPGTQVGRYEIQRRLGRGGMGSVYVAHDPVLGRMVAIKALAGDLDVPDARERFSREARAAAALSHPNIVTIYDFGEYDSQPYIVMEYVPGETVAGFIRRKTPVAIADKLRWMEELCAGAGYAHQMHLVHRDIKPANLIIDRSGRLKILDFGIARMLGIASNTSVMVGTPGYMAPEQITGDPVDHRADQFAIGVVFYELLAYTEAFPGDTLPMITNRILHEQPAPLAQLAPEAPSEIVAIVERALQKQPSDRFPDSETLRVAISRVRRAYSSSATWKIPTLPVSRDAGPTTSASRGTGSARRREDEPVGVAELTPPPDPRRTDREVLARRRTAQLEASLREARALLAKNELEAALDACQQALTFDENHAGALELEEEIEAALRLREGPEEATIAAPPAAPSSGQEPRDAGTLSEAVTRLDEQLAALAPPASDVTDRTVLRAPSAPADATIVAPPHRTPAPVAPPPAVPTPAPAAPVPAPAPAAKPAAKAAAPARPAPRSGTAGASSRFLQDPRSLAIAGGVVAVLAALVVGVLLLWGGAAPSGTLVIDAVPWGTVVSVETENGERQQLPSPASTPLALTLPAGSYRVVVEGPPPQGQSQQVAVSVEANTATVAPVLRFQSVTPEEYFDQYLAAPSTPPAPNAAPAEPAPAPAAVPAPGAAQ